MPPPRTFQAPPSKQWNRTARVNRAKMLRDKGVGRTPAELKELVDILLELLPPGTLT